MISGVGNVSGIAHANFSMFSTHNISFAAGGKLYVPVSPMMVGYTQFEHVKGVPSTSENAGVNISKIKILNTLIDRLIDMKQEPSILKPNSEMSDSEMDVLIKDFQHKIQSTQHISQSNPYALSGAPKTQVGALFSIAA